MKRMLPAPDDRTELMVRVRVPRAVTNRLIGLLSHVAVGLVPTVLLLLQQ